MIHLKKICELLEAQLTMRASIETQTLEQMLLHAIDILNKAYERQVHDK